MILDMMDRTVYVNSVDYKLLSIDLMHQFLSINLHFVNNI